MIDIQWIAAPVVGGLIGLITNSLAIKMLFRPLKPVFLGKHQLPFTPGLIPKEQPRIARAIGKVVGRDLLDENTLEKALCSDKIQGLLDGKIEELIHWAATDTETVGEFLARQGIRTEADQLAERTADTFCVYAARKLKEQDLGNTLIDYAMEEVIENLNSMVKMIAIPAIENYREGLAGRINDLIEEKAPEILEGYVDHTYENWMDIPMFQVGRKLQEHEGQIKSRIWKTYERVMHEKASEMVKTLDLENIVQEKITAFSPAEMERMVFEICHKELQAVIWLGGLLGMLMGFVNLLF